MLESRIRLGLGIITYNRRNGVLDCIDAAKRYTRRPLHLVVTDDGSSDDTVEHARAAATVVTGANRGVFWNKNRARLYLRSWLQCNVCILLEDDCVPVESRLGRNLGGRDQPMETCQYRRGLVLIEVAHRIRHGRRPLFLGRVHRPMLGIFQRCDRSGRILRYQIRRLWRRKCRS